ncbi:MAG: thiamine diphosphokinase [Pseudoflavonifractor sp.]
MPRPGDFLIAADGGYAWLQDLGLTPDLVIGDMDSLNTPPTGVEVLRLPREKDDTDMLAAVRVGMEKGCRSFQIYGGTGGRFDHTLANLQLLAWLSQRQCAGVLYGTDWTATAVTEGALTLPPAEGDMLSVFAWGGDALGVDLVGLKYPLKDATLTCQMPLGVSNEFTGVPACVSVKTGTLLVVQQG